MSLEVTVIHHFPQRHCWFFGFWLLYSGTLNIWGLKLVPFCIDFSSIEHNVNPRNLLNWWSHKAALMCITVGVLMPQISGIWMLVLLNVERSTHNRMCLHVTYAIYVSMKWILYKAWIHLPFILKMFGIWNAKTPESVFLAFRFLFFIFSLEFRCFVYVNATAGNSKLWEMFGHFFAQAILEPISH